MCVKIRRHQHTRVHAHMYMYVCKDSAAPAHARTRAHTGPRHNILKRIIKKYIWGCGLVASS